MADIDQLKERIVNYVMHTPGNTNPSVLRTMLDLLGSSGGAISEIQVAGVTIPPEEGVVNITNIDGVDVSNATILVEGEEKTLTEVIQNIEIPGLVSDTEDGLAPKLNGNETQLLEDGDSVLIMRNGTPLWALLDFYDLDDDMNP